MSRCQFFFNRKESLRDLLVSLQWKSSLFRPRYYIMDEGTMNGTFLNGTRLSVQKVVSERLVRGLYQPWSRLNMSFIHEIWCSTGQVFAFHCLPRFELSHLDELRIGSTTLQLHIHANHDTCKWCEPGLNTPVPEKPVAATISEPPALYKQRNKEMNRLKRKYKLMGSG